MDSSIDSFTLPCKSSPLSSSSSHWSNSMEVTILHPYPAFVRTISSFLLFSTSTLVSFKAGLNSICGFRQTTDF